MGVRHADREHLIAAPSKIRTLTYLQDTELTWTNGYCMDNIINKTVKGSCLRGMGNSF